MNSDFAIYLRVVAVFVLFFLVCFLNAMFRREAVKRDLFDRRCGPLRIWWMPFSLSGGYWDTCFYVRYRDGDGLLHQAFCCVYVALMDTPFGPRRVRWLKDKIKGE